MSKKVTNKISKVFSELKPALASYARSILAGALALYLAGVTDPLDLTWSLVAAVIPVLLRALNPNDPAFGILPSVEDVDKAVRSAKPKKSPLKKSVKK
jgi:hypothetical protein